MESIEAKKNSFVNAFFNKTFPLGYGNDLKILLKTAIPLVFKQKIIKNIWNFLFNFILKILGNLSQIFIATSSVLFCGHLGPDSLDAASLANSVSLKTQNEENKVNSFGKILQKS